MLGQAGVEYGEGVSMREKFEKVVRIILSKQKRIIVDKCTHRRLAKSHRICRWNVEEGDTYRD